MKILYVNDYGTPTGGAEVVIIALRDGMRARGHDARLFSSSAQSGHQPSQADYRCHGTLGRGRTALQAFNLSANRQIKHVIETFKPDVIHVKLFLTQLSPLILPALRNVPSLYHAVWYRAVCPLGTKTLPGLQDCHSPVGLACWENGCLAAHDWPLMMAQMKLLQNWGDVFDEIVPISVAIKSALAAEGVASGEPIPNGTPIRPMRHAIDPRPRLVFAGRLVKEKGVDHLLAAMAIVLKRFPAARLLIAGDGPERASLLSFANQLGIAASVEFMGHLSQELMEQKFEGAWAQIVPSRWAEPFGMVAVEAMMRGIAVIASDGGGLKEIVEHNRTGLLFRRGDIDSLTNAICNIVSDMKWSMQLGQRGREVAIEKYSMDKFLDRFERLYERMIAETA
ncbi:MAG TPA: glycosyltransferase family 4 protein [Tepidisphaeraceae bacterium]|nr:glycosyltransferase family 4 protein [Tepidisphaeraceae bacterium]